MKIEDSIENLKDSLYKINDVEAIKIYEEMVRNIEKKSLDIIFIGEKSVGKSTIINKLINKDILPTGIGTVTFNIFAITKGESDNVIVEYLDGSKNELILNKDNLANIQKNYESIERINIFLKDFPISNVNIIDIPGVGDVDENLTKIVQSIIPLTDSIVLVLDITRGLTKNISELLESKDIAQYKDKLFVLFNKLDTVPEDELNENLSNLKNELNKYYKDPRVYFITTRSIDNQLNQFQQFKKDIYDYIEQVEIKDVLEYKIKNYLNNIKNIVDEYIKAIEIINGNTKKELNEKLEKAKIEKNGLESQFNDFKSNLDNTVLKIKRCIDEKVKDLEYNLISMTKQDNFINKKDKINEINKIIKTIIYEIRTNCVEYFLNESNNYFNINNISLNENKFIESVYNLEKFIKNILELILELIPEEKLTPKIRDIILKTKKVFDIFDKLEKKLSKLDSFDDKIKELVAQIKKLIYDDLKEIQRELEKEWDTKEIAPIRTKIQLLENELEKLKNEKDMVDLKMNYYIEEHYKINSIIDEINKKMRGV